MTRGAWITGAALLGCHAPTAPEGTYPAGGDDTGIPTLGDSDSDDTGDPASAEDEAKYAALYDPMVVQQVRIELTAAAMDTLDLDGSLWVEGNVEVNGERLEAVGVRLKGSSTYMDFSGKPAFKIKFDKFVRGQRYATLERLTLNNMANDPTQSKEVLSYGFWNDQGLVAPRASYARVYVNGELFGLYANVESMDEHMLDRRYADAGGDLWEANDSADFTTAGLSFFELVTGTGDTDALEAVRAAVETAPDDEFFERASQVIDMTSFLDYWAWCIVIGNEDGYPYHLNDYYLYADPTDGLFDFSPWGMDEGWDTGMWWNYFWGEGLLGVKCVADPACLAVLQDRTREAVAAYEAADLAARAMDLWDLSDATVEEDFRRAQTASEVQAARTVLYQQILDWPDWVRFQMGL